MIKKKQISETNNLLVAHSRLWFPCLVPQLREMRIIDMDIILSSIKHSCSKRKGGWHNSNVINDPFWNDLIKNGEELELFLSFLKRPLTHFVIKLLQIKLKDNYSFSHNCQILSCSRFVDMLYRCLLDEFRNLEELEREYRGFFSVIKEKLGEEIDKKRSASSLIHNLIVHISTELNHSLLREIKLCRWESRLKPYFTIQWQNSRISTQVQA